MTTPNKVLCPYNRFEVKLCLTLLKRVKPTIDVGVGRLDDVLKSLEVDCLHVFELHLVFLAVRKLAEEQRLEVVGTGGKNLNIVLFYGSRDMSIPLAYAGITGQWPTAAALRWPRRRYQLRTRMITYPFVGVHSPICEDDFDVFEAALARALHANRRIKSLNVENDDQGDYVVVNVPVVRRQNDLRGTN